MYNTASFFTLGFTKFNMYMSLLMIGLAVWYLSVNYKKLILSLKIELENRLNRLFAGINRQPLYKVFYGFNHRDTASWVKWIKTQNLRQQERAFTRLTDHLQEPPKELGLITLEVVRAVVAFQHDDSYEVLTTLLKNARTKWGQYKALNSFYEEAAIGIIELNEARAKEFLVNELTEIKTNPDIDGIKSNILTALTHLTDKAELIKTFEGICLDGQHSLYIRSKAIVTMHETCTEEEFFSFLNNICLRFLALDSFNDDDLNIYKLAFNQNMDLFAQGKYNSEIWELWCKALTHKILGFKTAQILAIKIKDPRFSISSDKLQYLLKSYIELKDLFSNALAERFNLSSEELDLIKEANQNQEALSQYKNRTKAIEIYDQNLTCCLPQILESNYNDLVTQIQKLKNQMLLITGKAEIEKIYLTNLVAKELKRTFIHINAATLILSPDQMDKVLPLINDSQSFLIYIENVFEMLTNPSNPENNYRLKKFNDIIHKLQQHPRALVIASLPLDLVDLYDNYPEIAALVKNLPNDQFKASINMGTASARFKQKVYSHYEVRLKDDRDFSALKFDELLYQTEDLSSVEFLDYFLQYLSTSLLTEGKLMPLESSNHEVNKQLV